MKSGCPVHVVCRTDLEITMVRYPEEQKNRLSRKSTFCACGYNRVSSQFSQFSPAYSRRSHFETRVVPETIDKYEPMSTVHSQRTKKSKYEWNEIFPDIYRSSPFLKMLMGKIYQLLLIMMSDMRNRNNAEEKYHTSRRFFTQHWTPLIIVFERIAKLFVRCIQKLIVVGKYDMLFFPQPLCDGDQ